MSTPTWEDRPFEDLFAVPLRNGLNRPTRMRGSGIKMVNMGELFACDRIANLPMDRVELSSREMDSYLLEKGDLLFARQSLKLSGAGKCSVVLAADEPRTWEGHIIRVRLDRRLTDPDFYYYYFRSPQGRSLIESIVEQVAAAGIRGSDLRRLRVPYPPLAQQKEIAAALSALDDKVDLNRRMNESLLDTARAIFKSWFVNFDPVTAKSESRQPFGMDPGSAELFPAGFVDSPMGRVPTDWDAATLGEVTNVVRGRSYRRSELNESRTALVTLKSFLRGGGYRPDGLKPFTGPHKPEQVVSPGEVIVACTDVTQAAEVVGRPAIVLPDERFDTLVASLDVVILRPKTSELHQPFLYFLLESDEFRAYTYAHTTGTTVLHLDRECIPAFSFVRPSTVVLDAFSRIVQPMFQRIEANVSEIGLLDKLRDVLLPRLISGEVNMRATERMVEAAV